MSTQDPYGPSDPQRDGGGGQPSWQQPQRTGSSPAGGGQHDQQPHGGQQPYGDQQPYGGQQQGAQPYGYGDGRPARRNGLGVAALVLGIIALLFFWTVIAGLLGVVALVLGIVGARRAKRGEATNRGVAITGAVLGAISVVLAVLAVVVYGLIGSQFTDCFQQSAQGASQQQVQQCFEGQLGVPSSSLDS